MQFFAAKKPITEKIVHSLTTTRHAPRGSTIPHTKLCDVLLLSFKHDGWYNSLNPRLKEVLILRSHKPTVIRSLHPSSSPFSEDKVVGQGLSFKRVPAGAWRPSRTQQVKVGCTQIQSFTDKEDSGGNGNCLDAILVLAGGQVEGGGVPFWVERRLDRALELQQHNKHNCKIVCLGGGTPHKPPILSEEGFVVHESSSCAEYLHRRGVEYAHLLKEWGSYDTIGNGYFSLTQHVIPRGWRTLAVVTSEFHMARTRLVFEWIFGLQGAAVALRREQHGFRLHFHSAPDDGVIEDSIIRARIKRERNSIENLKILIQQIGTLEHFHEWFHTEHKAYNTQHQDIFGKEEKVDPTCMY